ncbi:MAG: restriction endonuclease subunit S, partial [Kiritimatiellae bacterium]|nr:restriction endonuclease subunit S [Kiritimatiellia bacterium]
ALDDKIENNRKICANLEAQAQAIFKSWFVDFEPFGGKMPQGWKMGKLGDVCSKITDGSHSSPKGVAQTNYPMLSVKDMGDYCFDYSDCKYVSKEDYRLLKVNGCVPVKDDVLVAKDGSYLKSIFIINENSDQAILSSIAIFRPDQTVIYPELLLWYLKSPMTLNLIRSTCVTGSGVPRIVLKDFKSIPILIPDFRSQDGAVEQLRGIRYEIYSLAKQSRSLAATRDALLPKLMSGEIDVEKVKVA